MSTSVYPPISPDDLIKEEEASLERELEWLLTSLQGTLISLKSGLQECDTLLAPREPGSTLVLSSLRSECLKGFVTRVGTRIIKGDIHLRLPSLPPPRGSPSYRLMLSSSPMAPSFALQQLSSVRNLINQSLDIVDVSLWTGSANDANFISGQLRLLFDNLTEAKVALNGWDMHAKWWQDPVDEQTFEPPLPSNVAFHLFIYEAALHLTLRTLEPANQPPSESFSGLNLRDRLAAAIGVTKKPDHDEAEEVFTYRGQEVRVKDRVRVESQDPSLMAIMAKLSALEHSVALSRKALSIVMGEDE
ncbi:MAG: hypothetical protein M1819_003723 [Sarea resinae]|nr:MAG: hypothetical protein M1819_003723 [Sarea resinae]